MPRDWRQTIENLLASRDDGLLQFAGVGNPIRSDDSVGLYIASKLRKLRVSERRKGMKILSPTNNPESIFSKLDLEAGRALIFDAVECNRVPGTIILAALNETQYGFFVTHNIPLRLIPELQSNRERVFILGIQPQSTEIGETLTPTVRTSADTVVEVFQTQLEAS